MEHGGILACCVSCAVGSIRRSPALYGMMEEITKLNHLTNYVQIDHRDAREVAKNASDLHIDLTWKLMNLVGCKSEFPSRDRVFSGRFNSIPLWDVRDS